jgi:hypothetical protein
MQNNEQNPSNSIKFNLKDRRNMMKKKTRNVFFVLVMLLMISCAVGGGGTATPDLQATNQAQQATIVALQNQPATQPPMIQPTATLFVQPTQETTPEEVGAKEAFELNTDFGTDAGYFSLLDGMKIENGSLFMGKFEKCADFSLELDQPQGCLAICKTCGEVSDYDIRFEITYDSGRTDQPVGFALRFVDKNGNQMIDRDDYFLGWVYTYYPGKPWILWEHVPMDYAGWHNLKQGEPNLRGKSTKPIIFRIISFNSGHRIALYMNDTLMFKIQNEDPEKTERIFYMKDMPNSGLIGFWVGARDVKIKGDNVTFTVSSSQPEDW